MTTFEEDFRKPIEVNGKKYYSVQQFAYLSSRSNQTIYRLIKAGNAVRKLTCEHVLGKPLIPVEELALFPFCAPGKNGYMNVVDYKGKQINAS